MLWTDFVVHVETVLLEKKQELLVLIYYVSVKYVSCLSSLLVSNYCRAAVANEKIWMVFLKFIEKI